MCEGKQEEVLVVENWTHWVVVSLGHSSWVDPVFIHHSASRFEIYESFVVAYIHAI